MPIGTMMEVSITGNVNTITGSQEAQMAALSPRIGGLMAIIPVQ